MRGILVGGLVIAAVVVVALATGLIDIGMSGGKAPEIEVTEGESPEVSVSTGSVDVGSKTVEVEVPTMSVDEAPDAQPEAEAEAAAEAQEEAAEEQN